MILAAGRGSRFKELTLTTPKPLIKVLGKPLIEYHLDKLQQAGFRSVVINISWLAEKLSAYIKNDYKGSLEVVLYNEELALETGGGVLAALPDLTDGEEPFLVINADVMSDFDYAAISPSIKGLACLYMVDNPEHHLAGDFRLNEGVLSQDNNNGGQSSLTFSGISVLSPKLFQGCSAGKFSLVQLFKKYMDQGLISGEKIQGQWFDVGTQERLAIASDWQAQRQKNNQHNSLHSMEKCSG